MIRLLEIQISCFDKKLQELGVNLPEEDIPSRAFIDLDKVTSVYAEPDGSLMIRMDHDSFWTQSYKLDAFVNIWTNGGMLGYVISQSGGIK